MEVKASDFRDKDFCNSFILKEIQEVTVKATFSDGEVHDVTFIALSEQPGGNNPISIAYDETGKVRNNLEIDFDWDKVTVDGKE